MVCRSKCDFAYTLLGRRWCCSRLPPTPFANQKKTCRHSMVFSLHLTGIHFVFKQNIKSWATTTKKRLEKRKLATELNLEEKNCGRSLCGSKYSLFEFPIHCRHRSLHQQWMSQWYRKKTGKNTKEEFCVNRNNMPVSSVFFIVIVIIKIRLNDSTSTITFVSIPSFDVSVRRWAVVAVVDFVRLILQKWRLMPS